MPPQQVRKYLQVNHLVTQLRPAMEELHARHPVVRLLDAGCGRSYLTPLLVWCARVKWGFRLEVLGVDRNPALIAECERRTALAELSDVVTFEAAPVESVERPELHGVIALHACDTATCDAIALGARSRAELPLCHAQESASDGHRFPSFAVEPLYSLGHAQQPTACLSRRSPALLACAIDFARNGAGCSWRVS